MVISVNPEPNKEEFDILLDSTITELNNHAVTSPEDVSKLTGSKLEPYIGGLMTELAVGTPFENSIKVEGGQKFPDIIANKYYGVEVKTTIKDHWKTTGNSVLESTRVNGVERIFMLFGKLADPIEFRCRPYEDCLSEVVVTHSPRYLIDMNLESGKTIFDKINTSYDVLRQDSSPIKPIVDYYKAKLKPGQDLWWIDNEESEGSSLVIKIWNTLDSNEREEIIIEGSAYFPEVYSSFGNKYSNFSLWLINSKTVVCPNTRDLFSSSGWEDYQIGNTSFTNVPSTYRRLFDRLPHIVEVLSNTRAEKLSEYWKLPTSESSKIYDWLNRVAGYAERNKKINHLDIKNMLHLCMNLYR